MQKKIRLLWAVALACAMVGGLSVGPAQAAEEPIVQYAKKFITQVTNPKIPWTGPTTGPKGVPGKFVVYVANDERNTSSHEVQEGAAAAAKILGWKFRALDGRGTVAGQSAALSQAIALKPDGIILGSVDAIEQKALIDKAEKMGIKIDGWHAGGTAGVLHNPNVFWNVTTNPPEVGKAAALLAIARSDGHANMVVFTDREYAVAIVKSNATVKWMKKCKTCTILALKDTPLAHVSSRMGQLTSALLTKYGKKWTYSMGINDAYFDFMAPALAAAGIKGDQPPYNISAGDGSPSAFQRIRSNEYQIATVAEPVFEQGWQTIDELNRAFAGAPPSGFIDPVHVFVHSNVNEDGGSHNVYNPNNGYKKIYEKIWGK